MAEYPTHQLRQDRSPVEMFYWPKLVEQHRQSSPLPKVVEGNFGIGIGPPSLHAVRALAGMRHKHNM